MEALYGVKSLVASADRSVRCPRPITVILVNEWFSSLSCLASYNGMTSNIKKIWLAIYIYNEMNLKKTLSFASAKQLGTWAIKYVTFYWEYLQSRVDLVVRPRVSRA